MAKILHLGWSFTPHTARWISELSKRNHEVALVSYGGDPLENVRTHVIPKSPLGKLGYLLNGRNVKKIARDFQPDIVHAHYATGYGYWGSLIDDCPFIISCHGSDITRTAQTGIPGKLVRNILSQADKLIVPSVFLGEQIQALNVKTKSPPELIQFGMDPSKTLELYQNRYQNQAKDQAHKLLYFKHYKSEYGPQVALEAFAKVKELIPKSTLTIAGSGPMLESLQQLTDKLGLRDAVSFPGFIPIPEAIAYISQHTLMLMPTIIPESFGVAALEAASVGVPTIGSDIGGIPEIVRDGQTGLLVPPNDPQALADAMLKILNDKTLLNQMSQNARELVLKEFNWSKKVDQLEALYQSLL